MRTETLCIAAVLAALTAGEFAIAAERAPQGMPDAGIFAPFVSNGAVDCVPLKTITDVGAQIMPLKDGTFRFLEGIFTLIPPISHDLPPGDRAVLAIGPHAETMGIIVDGKQTCARFMLPSFLIEMVADIESNNRAQPARPGQGL